MERKPLTLTELRTLVSLARRVLWNAPEARRQLQEYGINITPANFYSSLPLFSELDDSFEYREEAEGTAPYEPGGLFDKGSIAAFAGRLAAFTHEFDPPMEGDCERPNGFFWRNPAFSRLDAMAYYCVLRLLKPERVVEVGAGYSTLVANQALRMNGSGEIIVIEPYPKAFLRTLTSVSRIIERPVQKIPTAELVRLIDSCQVWFIDSTHTVKCGSDCLYLYLKVMPMVSATVTCHSHDVFLPYAMPQRWTRDKHVYWTEQYLLHAYLLDNTKTKVLFGSHYMYMRLPALAESMMHGRYPSGGGSLWYSLNGTT